MSQKSPFFREVPPPRVQKFLKISQPQKQLIFQHWKELFSAVQFQILQSGKSTIVIYKSGCFLTMACLQESCLTYQRKFKIMYSQLHEMTCLKLHAVAVRYKELRKRELLVLLGFIDGALELYHLIITDKTVVLKKYFSFESTIKHPVTNLLVDRASVLVSRIHEAQLYNDAITLLVDAIIQEEYAHETQKQKQLNCKVSNFALKDMSDGMAVSAAMGKQCVHVFNESQGSKTFLLETMQQYGSITDSICFMLELLSENLVIGDTNDRLKIIYKKRNVVERFRGFKNYCADGCNLVFTTHEELWVGDYNGCVTYFTRGLLEEEVAEKAGGMKMVDKEVRFSSKICENGIKKLAICGKLLIVLDTQSNILFFDIVRKDNPRDLRVQTVNSHSDHD